MTHIVAFTGSLMDGASVDLVAWSGLARLSDQDHDKLWGELNEQDLLELCESAD